MSLKLPNGEKIYIRERAIVGRNPKDNRIYVYLEDGKMILSDDTDPFVSRYMPEIGKEGSFKLYRKEETTFIGFVPLTATNPVKIRYAYGDHRETILQPGQQIKIDKPVFIEIGMGLYYFNPSENVEENKKDLYKDLSSKLYEFDLEKLKNLKGLVVVGDIHGDYETLDKVVTRYHPQNGYGILFLGDYADRGEYGVEVIRKINELITSYPDRVIALRGNHEIYSEDGEPEFYPCTLISEVKEKGMDWKEYFNSELKQFIEKLYIAAVIPGRFLFVHGGVSSKIKSLQDLRNPSEDIIKDVVWSDPYENRGEVKNPRGEGVLFGKDISEKVCKNLGVEKIIRSHQPRNVLDGKPLYQHNGYVITVASTRVYGGIPFVLIIDPRNFNISYVQIK